MLETIYEVDENVIFNDDLSKSTKEQTRLSLYMCWGIITGCFLIISFVIAMSLNPYYLSNHSNNKNTQNILHTSHDAQDKLKLSAKIIIDLDVFSYEVNEQLNLVLNPIIFLTSIISNSSLDIPNQSGLLWIYGYLKYPSLCDNDNQCKEDFHSKLKISFIELSDFLNTIEFDDSYDKQLQVDWCHLIETPTTATFVSLVSLKTIHSNATEKTQNLDRRLCEYVDHNSFLSNVINISPFQDSVTVKSNSINFDDRASTDSDQSNMQDETNVSLKNPVPYTDCNKTQPPETTHCPNHTGIRYFLMWNSY